MTHFALLPELLELLDAGDHAALEEAIDAVHPAEVADALAELRDAELWRFLSALPHQQAAEIFPHFELDRQVELATGAHSQAMARLLEDLPHDDRADLVQRLDPEVAEQILPQVARAEREDIRKLTSYPEGTAGAVMSSDYARVRPDVTVAQALEQVRIQAPTKETIYYVYVVDERRRLGGFVSLKDLILARPAQLVSEVMHEDVLSVSVDEDQEEVARNIEKYDLLAIPVVNGDGQMVGIITHDDAMDVIRQEQQEDIEKFMAIGGEHQLEDYLGSSAREHFRRRVGWVVALGVLGLVSGLIVQRFEDILSQLVILAAFMPMVADTGGNTGSQSATLVVRALALDRLNPRNLLTVLWKEFRVSIGLGLALALVTFGRVLVLDVGEIPPELTVLRVGGAISLALGLQVVSATLIGAFLPLVAAAAKLDPAIVASPALTTVVDITGLLIFFTTASMLLPL